jgi:hypothetical protein
MASGRWGARKGRKLTSRLLPIRNLRSLVRRVQRFKVEQLDARPCARRVPARLHDGRVDRVLVLRTRGVCGEEDDVVGGEGAVGELLAHACMRAEGWKKERKEGCRQEVADLWI